MDEAAPLPAEPAVPDTPGWHPDPTGRHRWRWFDGEGWSAEASDGDRVLVDRGSISAPPRRRLGPSVLVLVPGVVLALMILLAVKG